MAKFKTSLLDLTTTEELERLNKHPKLIELIAKTPDQLHYWHWVKLYNAQIYYEIPELGADSAPIASVEGLVQLIIRREEAGWGNGMADHTKTL